MNNNVLKKYTFWNNIDNQLSQNFDFSQTSISELANKSKQPDYLHKEENISLHEYIFKFYAYNELLSSYRTKNNGIIDNEDLKLYSDYQDFINDFSKKIFSYILYSSLTECRNSKFIKSKIIAETEDFNNKLLEAYIDEEIKNIDPNVKFIDIEEDITFRNINKINDKYKFTKGFIKDYKYLEYINREKFDDGLQDLQSDTQLLKTKLIEFSKEHYSIPLDIPEDFKNLFFENYKYENKKHIEAHEFFSEKYPKRIKNQEKFYQFFKFIEKIKYLDEETNFYNTPSNVSRKLVFDNEIQNSSIKDFTIEEMFEHLSTFFLDNFGLGFGNKSWSDIAKHALSFSKGEINAEIFIDQALSMEHNNGFMFNKNYIFEKIVPTEYIEIYYKDKYDDLEHIGINLDINDLFLQLQSSGSVLSISHLLNKEWSSLNNDIILDNNNKEYKHYNRYAHKNFLRRLNNNFDNLKSFTKLVDSLQPMLLIANKINYSIPSFNWNNISFIIAENFKNNYPAVANSFKNNKNPNVDFTNILQSNTTKNDEQNNFNKIKSKKIFQLHNLNSNNSKGLIKQIIGSKAYGLTNLINKGFNVPKALVFDTKTCLSYIDNKEYFNNKYKLINKKISDYLIDDNKQPLLVSVRSGAPVSMPGMMDSILNVGIDNSTYEPLCKIYGKEVIDQCAILFMNQFCSSKLGFHIDFPNHLHEALDLFAEKLIKNDIPCNRINLFPLSKQQQIKLSVEAVFDSWHSPRAIAWRNEKKIDHNMGTAATVQQMVFGNKNNKSLTCVIFSRDCITGKPDIMGEYLPQAQGEDLVSGKRIPLPISQLKISNPKVYQEIEYIAKTLEEEQKAIQDLEITVEDGKVFVLQMRNAVVSHEAQLALAKEMNLSLIEIIKPQNLIGNSKIDTTEDCNYNGLSGSQGLISGIIVRNQEDIDKYKNEGKDLIFFSNQALPEHAPIMIATQGFITEFGGATSHAAILARSMEKPCVVGIGEQEFHNLESGSIVTMDANEGKIWKGQLPIVVNQDKAIELANQLIDENKINLENYIPNKFTMHNWVTDLSIVNAIPKKENKHAMFLTIAQQVALVLQKNHIKESNLKIIM